MRLSHALGAVALAFALVGSSPAAALDAPHNWSSSPAIGCDACHVGHNAAGGTITTVSGNANLCMSCHNTSAPFFGTWVSAGQASPGVSGTSHRWDAPVVSAAHGSTTPTTPSLASRVPGGNLQCSTCHDEHDGATLFPAGTTQHVSAVTHTGGTGTLTPTVGAAAVARGYLVEMVTATTFRLSNDGGLSWFGWSGAAWVPYAGNARTTGAGLALNDAAVTVTFAGVFAPGERWRFYVSYPLLRAANDQSQLCEDCHLGRVQAPAYVESGGDGTKVFSHPVGAGLARTYDRTPTTLLDANGMVQATSGANADGIVTNDLRLDATGAVRCLSCHFPHGADSNSLTEDVR